MWKALWRKWTIDRPAQFGDWLWDLLVVQFAALLDRLTLKQTIAIIPIVILVVAYYHSIPIPPELMLLGDLDTLLLIVGLLKGAATISIVIRQAAMRVRTCASDLGVRLRRLHGGHRREHGSKRTRRPDRQTTDADKPRVATGFAWA